MWFKKKVRQFNSKNYKLDMVTENDEFYFLLNTLGSFTDIEEPNEEALITELASVTNKTKTRGNIHVETSDKTLIKWLKKFGFEEAK